MTKRLKKVDDDLLNEMEEMEEENPLERFGLLPEGQPIRIYRKVNQSEREYVGEVVAPYDIDSLKNDFGGGIYYLIAYKNGKMVANGKVRVAGQVKYADIPEKSDNISDANSKISEVAEIIKAVNEIKGSSGTATDAMEKMLTLMSTTVMTAMTNMLTTMTDNMKMIQELKSDNKGSTVYDLLGNALNNISEVALEYIAYKKNSEMKVIPQPAEPVKEKKVKKEPEKKQENFIDLLNRAQKEKLDVKKIAEILNNSLEKSVLAQVKIAPYDLVIVELKKYGLEIIDEKWLQELLTELKK